MRILRIPNHVFSKCQRDTTASTINPVVITSAKYSGKNLLKHQNIPHV